MKTERKVPNITLGAVFADPQQRFLPDLALWLVREEKSMQTGSKRNSLTRHYILTLVSYAKPVQSLSDGGANLANLNIS